MTEQQLSPAQTAITNALEDINKYAGHPVLTQVYLCLEEAQTHLTDYLAMQAKERE